MGYRTDVDAGGRRPGARVHSFVDRLVMLGTPAFAACRDRRVALIDSGDNELQHRFAEYEARRRGYEVRSFRDMASAMAWLDAADH